MKEGGYLTELPEGEKIVVAGEEGLIDFIDKVKGLSNSIISNPVSYLQNNGYRVLSTYTNGIRSYVLEKKQKNLLNEEIETVLLGILNRLFGKDNIISIGIFGSFINGENNKYSDYDIFLVLDHYDDDDIYEREKNSPIIKKELFELGIPDLFAFNFYSKEELKSSKEVNPFLIETMKKSFYILKDEEGYIDNLFSENKSISHKGGCTWLGDFRISKKRMEQVMKEMEDMSSYKNSFSTHYSYESTSLKYLEILISKGVFTSRLDFSTIHEFLDDPLLISHFYEIYRENSVSGKMNISNYSSFGEHYSFANQLISEDKKIGAIRHYYLALKNILSSILHDSGLYIIDGEFTQSFVHNFGHELPPEILDTIFNSLFKSEQILGRTGLVSFDLKQFGEFIYENGNYEYNTLIEGLLKLINYFEEHKNDIILENNDKILIVTEDSELLGNQVFPSKKISYTKKSDLTSSKVSKYTYVLIHNQNYLLSSDYLLKSIAYLQSGIGNLVSGKRVTSHSISTNKYANFMFKGKDFEEHGKNLFKKQLTFIGAEYFPKQ